MFRSAIHRNPLKNTILQISKQNRNQSIRWQSTSDQKSNTLKVGLVVGSSVIVVGGVAVAYAKYDSGFRNKIQNSIPYSEILLNSLIGPIVQNKESNLPPISDSRDKAIESSLLKKKQEREKSLQQSQQPSNPNAIQKTESSSPNKPENKKADNSQQSSAKTEPKSETQEPQQKSPSEENNVDRKSEPPAESPLLDIDVMIAKEALKEQLLNLLPTDDEKVERLKEELQKRESDMELEHQRKIAKLQDQFEEELKQQLKRQLAAFNDHLQDQLSTLRHELKRKHQNSLEEKILQEKTRYQSELSNSFYRLQSIEEALKAREQLDRDERSAKELWVLSQSLKDALVHNTSSIKEECSPLSLTKEISAVKKVLNEDLSEQPLIKLALESIPNEALKNGVYSEEDLIKRFTKVDRICKRVALIGDDGGSLYKYILSYLQSLLVFSNSKIPLEELEDQEVVDPSKWDTFDILTRVRHCLKNHNLEMALRYANQLRGEARNVAQDWIRDTRTHLETRQAVDLLQSEAASIHVQVLN